MQIRNANFWFHTWISLMLGCICVSHNMGCSSKSSQVSENAELHFTTPQAVYEAWLRAIENNDIELFLRCYSQEEKKWTPFIKSTLTAMVQARRVRRVMRSRFGEDAWEEFNSYLSSKVPLNPITAGELEVVFRKQTNGHYWVHTKGDSIVDRITILNIAPYKEFYVADLGLTGSLDALYRWVGPVFKGIDRMNETVDSVGNLQELAEVYIDAYNEYSGTPCQVVEAGTREFSAMGLSSGGGEGAENRKGEANVSGTGADESVDK